MPDAEVITYSIYDHPADQPDYWVVRRWRATAGRVEPEQAWIALSLEHARQLVPEGAVNLGRQPQDDPVIYETWMV